MPRMRIALLLATTWLAVWLGCSPSPVGDGDSGISADAGTLQDSGTSKDAGTVIDAGRDSGFDAGPVNSDAGAIADAGSFPDAGAPDANVDAGPGQVTFTAQVTDFCNNRNPLPGIQVSTLTGGTSVISDTGGNFSLPVPPGAPFTIVLQYPGYQTAYFPELNLSASETSPIPLPMFCASGVQAMQQALVGYNTQDGAMFAGVSTLATSGPCTDQSGWQFHLAPTSGEQVAYIDNTGNPNSTLTSTSSWGYAIVYNIGVSRVSISVDKPDAGCTNASSTFGLTGYVDISPSALSYGGVFIQ
jgi:carboxypeptidase family protein